MGTEGKHRSEEQYQGWQVDNGRHMTHFPPVSIRCNVASESVMQTARQKQASWSRFRPFMVHPTLERVFLIEAWLGSVSCTRAKTMRYGRNDKSVPLTASTETVFVLYTYCFFCACEARSLAFSLAASAVSFARSVAVSAKVLDGVSPEGETDTVHVQETFCP